MLLLAEHTQSSDWWLIVQTAKIGLPHQIHAVPVQNLSLHVFLKKKILSPFCTLLRRMKNCSKFLLLIRSCSVSAAGKDFDNKEMKQRGGYENIPRQID